MTESGTTQELAHGNEVVFTADETSRRFALDELLAVAPGSRLIKWLVPGVGRASLTISWDTLVERFHTRSPIFIRHIFPAQRYVPLEQDEADLDRLADVAARFRPPSDPNQPFSVQTRILDGDFPYGPFDVNTRLSDVLKASGGVLNVREPVWVLSVVLTPKAGLMGFSRAENNLSDWAGGVRRFRKEEGQISRAEFKLLEALEVFGLSLPVGGTALDLGAAPGGWTRMLVQKGLRVVAVDPADMAPSLQNDPHVHHVRSLAQDFLPGLKETFDVVLNDMRVDARESALLMRQAIDALKPEGWALMTLKLPTHAFIETMTDALNSLSLEYEIVGVRQLFHNRSEVTVALRPGKE